MSHPSSDRRWLRSQMGCLARRAGPAVETEEAAVKAMVAAARAMAAAWEAVRAVAMAAAWEAMRAVAATEEAATEEEA